MSDYSIMMLDANEITNQVDISLIPFENAHSRIKAMANSGHTNAEIAEALGISTSAVSKYLNS